MPYYLKPNHQNTTPRHYVVVDTETQGNAPEGERGVARQTLVYGYALYRKLKHYDGNQPVWYTWDIEFTDTRVFWAWVKQIAPGAKQCLRIYAHNQNYDLGILNLAQGMAILGAWVTRYINGKPPLIIHATDKTRNYQFLDTLNYWPMSLKRIAELWGLPRKGEFSPDMGWDALRKYCQRDVTILADALSSWFAFIRDHQLGNYAATTPAQAWNAYRHRFMPKVTPIRTDKERVTQLEREAYMGGRVECFRLGAQRERLYMLDINSMYPYVMKTYEYPARFIRSADGAEARRLYARHTLSAGLIQARVTTDTPGLPVRHDGRLVFPVGTFTGVWYGREFRAHIPHMRDYRIQRIHLYQFHDLFTAYVEYFYGLRLQALQDGNSALASHAKLMLNSLYGKLGQRSYAWEDAEPSTLPDGTQGVDILEPGAAPLRWRVLLGLKQYQYPTGEARHSVPIVAAGVTANARVTLNRYMSIADYRNVYYCDTDSLLVNQTGLDNLQLHTSTHLLGKLKVQWSCDQVVLEGPKRYRWSGGTKHKGIRPGAIRLAPNLYRQIQFTSFHAHLMRGEHGFIDIVNVDKVIDDRYRKGELDASGRVKPLVFPLGSD